MFQSPNEGAEALTVQPDPTPNPQYEIVRHMLFGRLSAVRATIHLLHKLNYAEPNDWSHPMSMGRPNEVMAILTKRARP